MLFTLIPKRIKRGLDLNNISVGCGSFSDGNGQHTYNIPERARGRQAKMGKSAKSFGGWNLMAELFKIGLKQ